MLLKVKIKPSPIPFIELATANAEPAKSWSPRSENRLRVAPLIQFKGYLPNKPCAKVEPSPKSILSSPQTLQRINTMRILRESITSSKKQQY